MRAPKNGASGKEIGILGTIFLNLETLAGLLKNGQMQVELCEIPFFGGTRDPEE